MPLFQVQSERLPLRAVLIRSRCRTLERRLRVTAAAGVIMAALIGTFSREGSCRYSRRSLSSFCRHCRDTPFKQQATQVLIGSFALMIVVMYFIGGPLLERFNDIGNATDLTTVPGCQLGREQSSLSSNVPCWDMAMEVISICS
ncbi:MAG: hypothetical protein R3D03_01450 [Geminicoccaceae bacterium]